jgi:hypothetical protein
MTSILTVEEHQTFTNMLNDWGIPCDLITDTLKHAVFGPGVVAHRAADDIPHGIALMFDEQRDIEFATCSPPLQRSSAAAAGQLIL